MERCLVLAQKGRGNTYPNPMVGALLVKDNKIISEGWHQKAGTAHAEVNALSKLHSNDLKDATLYVNLEPCSHQGKTPPCCDLVIEKGIKKVVVGAKDPNPKVAGKGIKAMQKAGINVVVGVLEKNCIELNKRFYCFHTQNRPYIILKWAQSIDGFLAPKEDKKGSVSWISDDHSQQLVHRWRAEEHAVLIGRNTVEADNPKLTTRKWKGTNPIRLIIDPKLNINPNHTIFNNESQTIVFNYLKKDHRDNIYWEQLNRENPLESLLEITTRYTIQSIIIEGGAITLNHFLNAKLWDECRIFYNSKNLNDGVKAPNVPKGILEEKKVVRDILQVIKN